MIIDNLVNLQNKLIKFGQFLGKDSIYFNRQDAGQRSILKEEISFLSMLVHTISPPYKNIIYMLGIRLGRLTTQIEHLFPLIPSY